MPLHRLVRQGRLFHRFVIGVGRDGDLAPALAIDLNSKDDFVFGQQRGIGFGPWRIAEEPFASLALSWTLGAEWIELAVASGQVLFRDLRLIALQDDDDDGGDDDGDDD